MNLDDEASNKVIKGAFLLTLAGFIGKLLSAGYRIPLQNLTGDTGFYIYQQIYPILGMITIVTLYGFPSAISKLSAEMQAAGRERSLKRFYVPLFVILSVLAGGLFFLLYLNASNISNWIGDKNLASVYQLAAFTFLLIPFSAIPRGLFQGMGDMRPTAYSQVSEQFVRVFIIIAVAIWVAVSGKNVYVIGKAAVLASITAGIAASGVLAFFMYKRKPFARSTYSIPWGWYIKSLTVFGLFFALNHMLLVILQLADAFTLLPGLIQYGLDKATAMDIKGVFDRGQPFIQLGAVLGSSFSLALIPNVSMQRANEEPLIVQKHIRTALSFSTYIAFGATLGLILIFAPANRLLYKNTAGTESLQILVIAILLSAVAITAVSILQGLGYMKRTALYIGCAFLAKWILNMLLVPWWGITGSSLATVGSLLLLTALTFHTLHRKLPRLQFFQTLNWRALFFSGSMMAFYIFLIRSIGRLIQPETRLAMLFYVVFMTMSGAFIYLYLLIRSRAFSEAELAMLPFAAFFIRLHRGRNKRGSH